MSIETDADRLEMLKQLGEEIHIANEPVWAVFDNDFAELEFDVESSGPRAEVRDIDIIGITRGTEVRRSGVKYTVSSMRPDGTGMTLLRLAQV